MREGSKQLRRLGFAAVFVLAASAAAAQTHQFATGQRNLACGVPPPSAMAGRPRRRKASASMVSACAASPRGCWPPRPTFMPWLSSRHGTLVFEQYFPGYDEPWGMGEGQHDFDATDQTRHALGFEERDLAAGGHCDRSRTDQERRRARRQILSGLFGAEIAGLGQHHPASSAHHVVGHAVGREPRLERSARTTNRISAMKPTRPLCPVKTDRGATGHGVGLQWRRNGSARQYH